MDDDRRDALNQVGVETIRFLRANYWLDERGDGRGEVRFSQEGKDFLAIWAREDRFDFALELEMDACVRLLQAKGRFSAGVREAFATSQAEGDVVTLRLPVEDLDGLEEVKQLLLLAKAPDRASLPEENSLQSHCGMRCPGCPNKTEALDCPPAGCFSQRGREDCLGCADAPCDRVALPQDGMDPAREVSAQDIALAAPYVYKQYEDE